ncbi:esterase/lipase family protein [Nocardia bovistercoris]|uniref:Lipase n=1 Tax=Nocardia bovistercoris TaxID=2785916 RepID=A0A931I7M7_9NOCA|nr:lipase [Nocardia bovistercoris]MBH0775766.1 lipase [Nocardia bovistercoris]
MLQRLLVLATAAAAVVTPFAANPSAHAADAPRAVVIFVPGQSVGPLPYEPMAASLRADGYATRVLDLNGFDMTADAVAIARAVDTARGEHPKAPVALVTHSVGAVSGRHYLRELGGADKVATYVAIGAPQYGSPAACGQPVGAEVCPGTEFMTNLNRGDDTHGATAYYSIRSEREWTDGRLDGGQCRLTPFPTLGNGGLDHSLEPLIPAVETQVRAAVDGVCAGEYADEPDGAVTAESSLWPTGIPYS